MTLMNAAKAGTKMPVAGIGTWPYVTTPGTGVPGEMWNDTIAEKAISEWIMLGGRRIDSASNYYDQVGIGKAVKLSGVAREEIFLTSKISLEGYNETFQQTIDYSISILHIIYEQTDKIRKWVMLTSS